MNSVNRQRFKINAGLTRRAGYGAAFGWTFTDCGPDYVAFEGEGTDGGFSAAEGRAKPLVILYAQDLERCWPR